jgi:hypothetical protein
MEKRYRHTYDGHVVAGQIDAYEISTKTLADVKTSGCYKVQKGDYDQWEKQLNVGAALMRHNGYEVENLQIVALLKDWAAIKAKTDRSYPQLPIAIIPIDMWSQEQADDYIEERLALHFSEDPKTCTNAERWTRPGKFAVHKIGHKRAARLLDTEDAAKRWGDSQLKTYEIVERPTVYTRCDSFCPFNKWCDQYKESK